MEKTEALAIVDDIVKFYLKRNTDCDPIKVMMAVEYIKLGPEVKEKEDFIFLPGG